MGVNVKAGDRSLSDKDRAHSPVQRPPKPRATIRGCLRTAGIIGAAAITSLAYNRIEAELFSRDSNQRQNLFNGAIRVNGVALKGAEREILEKSTPRIESWLKQLATIDPCAKRLLARQPRFEIIDSAKWGHPPGVLCAVSINGAFQLNSTVIRFCKGQYETDSNNAESIAAGVVPYILGLWRQEELRQGLNHIGLPETLLASSELTSITLAEEELAREYIRGQLAENSPDLYILHNDQTWFPGWKFESGCARPPQIIHRLLRTHWALASADEIINENSSKEALILKQIDSKLISERLGLACLKHGKATLSESAIAFINAAVAETTGACANVQHNRIHEQLMAIGQIFDYPLYKPTSPLGSTVFERLYSPEIKARFAALQLARATSAIGNNLTDQELDAISPILTTCIGTLCESLSKNIKPKDQTVKYVFSNEVNEQCASACITVIRNLQPGTKQYKESHVKLLDTFQRLNSALITTIEKADPTDYATYSSLIPAAQQLLELHECLQESGDSSVKQLRNRLNIWTENNLNLLSPNMRELFGDDYPALASAINLLSKDQQTWIALYFSKGVIFPSVTAGWEYYMGPDRAAELQLFRGEAFKRLPENAKVAALQYFTSCFPGSPRCSVSEIEVFGKFQRLPDFELKDLSRALDLSKSLNPECASLFIRGFCAVPRPERSGLIRFSSADYSEWDHVFSYLCGDSQTAPGPLLQACNELTQDLSLLQQLKLELSRANVVSTWAYNVSILSASRWDQLSWNTEYSSIMRSNLSSMGILDAHHATTKTMESSSIAISHPLKWIKTGLDNILEWQWNSPELEAGIYYQNPCERHGTITPEYGVSNALIVYGENRLRDLTMRFDWDAQHWKTQLTKAYGTSSVTSKVSTFEDLEALIDSTFKDCTLENDVAIVVIAHGGTSTFSNDVGPYAITQESVETGSAWFGKSTVYEPQFKKAINERLSGRVRSITIIFDTCHAGAMVD